MKIMIIRYIWAWILTTFRDAPKQKSWMKQVQELELAMVKKYPVPPSGPLADFPDFDKCAEQYKSNFIKYITSDEVVPFPMVSFGNSIGDFARGWLYAINTLLNFCKGGFWIHHMVKMYKYMKIVFDQYLFKPSFIFLETPGGNNLLWRQDVDYTIKQWIEFLNLVRSDYPDARIIIGDYPSSIDVYIIANKAKVTAAITDWMKTDKNCVLLLFIKNYVKSFHILPKTYETHEGVHMSPLGMIQMDDELMDAMTGPSRIIP